MDKINQALLASGSNIVENIIVSDAGFTLEGYVAIEIKSGVFCQPGMFYNADDGLFYDDAAFTLINAPVEAKE